MSIRKIPIQTRSVAGNFYSYKNKRVIKFESQLEKKCFLLLEFDDNVITYIEQPLKIERYIPDILVKTTNNKDILIEVKYSSEAFNPDEKLKKKFEMLEEYAKNNNLLFKIFTEKEITEPYFSNISLIYNYANINLTTQDKDNIVNFLQKNNLITLKDIIEKGFNIAFIYNLVFNKIIDINLYKKISLESIIRINYV